MGYKAGEPKKHFLGVGKSEVAPLEIVSEPIAGQGKGDDLCPVPSNFVSTLFP
jgi:hypothetical protein